METTYFFDEMSTEEIHYYIKTIGTKVKNFYIKEHVISNKKDNNYITLRGYPFMPTIWKNIFTNNDLLTCLLYTSDAADEEDSVDLGGRRIIKKKRHKWIPS